MSIKIIPVRFTENGFMTRPFALGGEGAEGLDPAVRYRSCLQNWVIDTGSEVILVDTGLPAEFPETAPDPDAGIYLGTKIKTCGYVYDPAEHDGVAFEDLPVDWRCPRCKRPKSAFNRA